MKSDIALSLGAKFLVMLVSLGIVEATYRFYNSTTFILFNNVLFYFSLLTCITYPLQVAIWHRKSQASYNQLIFQFVVIGLLGLVFLTQQNNSMEKSFLLYISFVSYLLYKSFERTIFNLNLTFSGQKRAYVFTIFLLCLELFIILIAVWVTGYSELIKRFNFVGVPLAVFCGFLITREFFSVFKLRIQKIKFNLKLFLQVLVARDNFFVILNIFFLILATLIDRISINYLPVVDQVKSQYLYVYSYAGAIYSLITALIDYYRVKVIARVNELKLGQFLLSKETIAIFATILAIYLISFPFLYGFMSLFGNMEDFPVQMVTICLVSAYCLFSLSIFFQLYFFAKEKYGFILSLWAFAGTIKILYQFRFCQSVEDFAISNVVSGIGVLGLTLILTNWSYRNES